LSVANRRPAKRCRRRVARAHASDDAAARTQPLGCASLTPHLTPERMDAGKSGGR
jgi:hypothetical protein